MSIGRVVQKASRAQRLVFPFPLGIGTDICSIPRIKRLLNRPGAAKFVRRILTPREIGLLSQRYSEGDTAWWPLVLEAERQKQLGADEVIGNPAKEEAVRVDSGQIGDASVTGAVEQHVQRDCVKADGIWLGQRLAFERAARFMAGRFAAKEAAIKAHNHRRLGFHDIHILYRERNEDQGMHQVPDARGKSGIDGDGPRAGNFVPYALIVGENGELDQEALLSISHDKDYATATCLGFVPTPDDAALIN